MPCELGSLTLKRDVNALSISLRNKDPKMSERLSYHSKGKLLMQRLLRKILQGQRRRQRWWVMRGRVGEGP